MQTVFDYDYTPDLIQRGCKRFMLLSLGWQHGLLLAALIASSLYMLLTSAHIHWVWLAILAGCIYFIYAWVSYFRRAQHILATMPSNKMQVEIRPQSITIRSSEHETTMKWSRIKQLLMYPDVWLLFTYDLQTYTILPAQLFDSETQQWIQQHIISAGGKAEILLH